MIRDAIRLVTPFFRGSDKRYARYMGLFILSLSLGAVALTSAFNSWRGRFYDAIQGLQFSTFQTELLIFSGLAAVAILLYTFQNYLTQLYTQRWRVWYTKEVIRKWSSLTDKSQVENADQRIQEDVRLLTRLVAALTAGILGAVTTILVFTPILWGLSEHIKLFGHKVPGSLFILSILFAIGGSAVCFFVGRKIPKLQYNNQKAEADFRYILVEARQGKHVRNMKYQNSINLLDINYKALFTQFKLFGFCSNSYFQLAIIVPFVVAAPSYFEKLFTLGVLMQIAHGFGVINDSMTYLLERYLDITELKSAVIRLTEFNKSLEV